jgi:hypothetical protein
MHAFIVDTLLASDATRSRIKPFEIFDSRLPGFTLRVQVGHSTVQMSLREFADAMISACFALPPAQSDMRSCMTCAARMEA